MRYALASLSLLVAVTGCVPPPVTYWDKPGGDTAAFEAASTACQDQAMAAAPPRSLGLPGYFPNPTTWCEATSGGTNCLPIGAGYLPQSRSEADTNAVPRMAAFQTCMMAAGWRPVASDAPIAPPLSKAAIAGARAYCDAVFKGKKDPAVIAAFGGDYHACLVARTRLANGTP